VANSNNFDGNVLLDSSATGASSPRLGFGRDANNEPTGPCIIHSVASPNGVTSAPAGSLALGDDGIVYQNTDGSDTGWVAFATTNSDVFLAPNEYYVDTTAAAQPTERIYPTIEAAYAAGVVAFGAGKAIVIRLRERQTHALDLANLASNTMRVAIYSHARDATVNLAGICPAAVTRLRFDTVTVTLTAAADFGTGRTLVLNDAVVFGQGFTVQSDDLIADNTSFDSIRWTKSAGASLVYTLTNCTVSSAVGDVTPTIFQDGASGSVLTNCTFDIAEADFIFYTSNGGVATTTFQQCSLRVNQTGAGAATLFNTGGAALRALGVTIHSTLGGAGSIGFGTNLALASDSYFTMSGDAIKNLPYVNNLANPIAFTRDITSVSAQILGSNETLTAFSRTITLPANAVSRVGDIIEVIARVPVIVGAPETADAIGDLYIDGTEIWSPTGVSFAGVGAIDFTYRLRVTDITIAAGKVVPMGFLILDDGATVAPKMVNRLNDEKSGLDFSIAQVFSLKWQWGVGTTDSAYAYLADFSVRVIRVGA
jgi:hypothetical protein